MARVRRPKVIEIKVPANFKITLTRDRLRRDITEFSRLLDTKAEEQRINTFLTEHSYFFNRLLRMNGKSPLYSEVKLGSEYEIDFAFFDSGSNGPEWHLVEIESPTLSFFTKSGRPSANLTHAIQQVRDWQSWIHNNLSYARRLMPSIEYPLGCIFAGRRSAITHFERFRRLCYEHRQYLEIHTLDWFIDSARGVFRGGWTVPMKALSHRDLRHGLPPEARRWIRLFAKGGPFADEYPDEMLRDRRWKYQRGTLHDNEI